MCLLPSHPCPLLFGPPVCGRACAIQMQMALQGVMRQACPPADKDARRQSCVRASTPKHEPGGGRRHSVVPIWLLQLPPRSSCSSFAPDASVCVIRVKGMRRALAQTTSLPFFLVALSPLVSASGTCPCSRPRGHAQEEGKRRDSSRHYQRDRAQSGCMSAPSLSRAHTKTCLRRSLSAR